MAASARREVDLRTVGGTGGRGRLAALGWGVGLVVLVAIALGGRLATAAPGPAADASARGAVDPVPSEPAAPRTSEPPAGRSASALVILEPGVGARFRAGGLQVIGRRDDGRAGAVRLTVLDERGRVLAQDRLETSGTFETRLRVPNPPQAGTIWLEIAAYVGDGSVVAATTRSLRVLPQTAEDGPVVGSGPSRPIGEDGIMGGRPFGQPAD